MNLIMKKLFSLIFILFVFLSCVTLNTQKGGIDILPDSDYSLSGSSEIFIYDEQTGRIVPTTISTIFETFTGDYLPVATPSVLGGVKPDGSTITVTEDGTISSIGGDYTLPPATADILGGIKVGAGLSVTGEGILSASGEGGVVKSVTNGGGLNLDGTGDLSMAEASDSASGAMTSAQKAKLDGIAAGAEVNTVASVADRTGDVTLTSTDVGLSNVDNTTDLDKPVSTATQTVFDTKVDKVAGQGLMTEEEKTKLSGIETGAEVNTVTSVNSKTGAVSLDKSDIGLGNADNTADIDKPVSTLQASAINNAITALDLKSASKVDVGTSAGNIPVLGATGKLDENVLPALDFTDINVVDTEADMTNLSDAGKGDVCVTTESNKTYILATNNPSELDDWKQLLFPSTDVTKQYVDEQDANTISAIKGTDLDAAYATLAAIADIIKNNKTLADQTQADLTALTTNGAAKLSTTRKIFGVDFNGTADVTGDVTTSGVIHTEADGNNDVLLAGGGYTALSGLGGSVSIKGAYNTYLPNGDGVITIQVPNTTVTDAILGATGDATSIETSSLIYSRTLDRVTLQGLLIFTPSHGSGPSNVLAVAQLAANYLPASLYQFDVGFLLAANSSLTTINTRMIIDQSGMLYIYVPFTMVGNTSYLLNLNFSYDTAIPMQ
ncbi:hypothetical protein EZS27_003900 [termite gut metagenome]|uniref:Uncharacterized protein n=1 Tax=termite gut metagenome TaxID=433724 RepID=A0A5J4SRM0_9ZZZZ